MFVIIFPHGCECFLPSSSFGSLPVQFFSVAPRPKIDHICHMRFVLHRP